MKSRSLFSDESAHEASPKLFGAGEDSDSSATASFVGNLYQASDTQIRRLISLKFNGDHVALIKQLSYDLAKKEAELILVRKENFRREHELSKICNEYGNLSRLEVDKKLSELNVETSVDTVLSGLIESAMNVKITDEESSAKNSSIIPKTPAFDNSQSTVSTPREVNKNQSWLTGFFQSLDDLSKANWSPQKVSRSESTRTPNRSLSKSFSDFTERSFSDAQSNNREPVELDSISLKKDIFVAPSILSVDKYGFFNESSSAVVNEKEAEENDDDTDKPSRHLITPSNEMISSSLHSSMAQTPDHSVTSFKANGTTTPGRSKDTYQRLKEIGQIHDLNNLQVENNWDVFLRELLKDHHRYLNKSTQSDTDLSMKSYEVFGTRGLNLKKLDKMMASKGKEHNHYHNLVDLVTFSGIPAKYRHDFWLELSGAKNLKVNGEFHQLYEIAKSTEDSLIRSSLNQIDLDLHRTLPSNIYFNDFINSQPGPHYYKLKKILYAFVAYKPSVGYAQGMNKIVGNLLLSEHDISEEDVFWIFISLIEEILPHYEPDVSYFSRESLMYLKNDQRVMIETYFPKVLPNIHAHFEKLNIQIEYITVNWFWCLFTDSFMNLEIWFKIFDNLLVSYPRLKLVSLSLATFKVLESQLLAITNRDDIYITMKNLNHIGSTKMNLRFSDLMSTCVGIERKIDMNEFQHLAAAMKTEATF